jgi:hypothetical protein
MADDDYGDRDIGSDPDIGDFENAYRPSGSSSLTEAVAFIRTSDRQVARRCRRKFNWSYLHRGNRTGRGVRSPLWLGTGFHFAVEDLHGYRHFDRPSEALEAYAQACKRSQRGTDQRVPDNWQEDLKLGMGMLEYYEEWLQSRPPLQTYEVNGVPQVEVRFQIPIPMDPGLLRAFGFDRAVYTGTIDRVIIDEYNRLWPLDYKTAKRIQTNHLENDPQVSAYMWAASHIYSLPVAGFIYQQHLKGIPKEPDFLKTSGMFSVSKNLRTTHTLYAKALRNLYGNLERAPRVNIEYLNMLIDQEQPRSDKLVSQIFVERNQNVIEAEGEKILLEAADMLNPSLPIYPNPTRDCSWDCDFLQACLSVDDGSDWQWEIEQNTFDREEEDVSWRTHLQLPQRPQPLPRLHRGRNNQLQRYLRSL